MAMMGTVYLASGPFLFFEDGNGNLLVNWFANGSWSWSSLGIPPGVDIDQPIGVTTVDGENGLVFTTGSDGNLWCCTCTQGGTGTWANQGTPASGIVMSQAVGAVSMGTTAFAFAIGSDGNLWCSSGGTWTNLDTPSSAVLLGSQVGVTVASIAYVFVLGSDGNLWCCLVPPNGMGTWSNQGCPSGVALSAGAGATTLNDANSDVYAFAIDSTGNIQSNWVENPTWTNLGLPPNVSSISYVGLTAGPAGNANLFALGSDGNLWCNSAGNWSNQGAPQNGVPLALPGCVTSGGGGNAYVFIANQNGRLWLNAQGAWFAQD